MGRALPMNPAADMALDVGQMHEGGWLCPTKADRVRLTDMSAAVRTARLLFSVFFGVGVLAISPFVGIGPLVVFAVAAGPLLAFDRALDASRRPERWVAASLSFHATLISVGVCMSGGVRSPFLPWIAIPVCTAAARFRPAVFVCGSVLATVEVFVASAISAPGALAHDPAPVIGVFVLVATLVAAQRPLLASEVRWRHEAVLDPLTGLLNRQGLDRRFREVAEQARLTDSSLAVVMCDLDHFKALNDRHGHPMGDAVLKDLAYLVRKQLRSFELLYRIGGEELLLVLPGATEREACEIAELVRSAIEHGRPAGQQITASLGVYCATGNEMDFEPMFQAADQALYAAKQGGRNRVATICADSATPVLLPRGGEPDRRDDGPSAADEPATAHAHETLSVAVR